MSATGRFAIGVAVLVALAGPASGQPEPPPRDAAAARAAEAKRAFDAGDFTAAIEGYREAYRLLPSPGLLYNLAQAYRLGGDCARAARAYRDYLRLVPDSPYRTTAEQNLAAAEVCARDAAAPGSAQPDPARDPGGAAHPDDPGAAAPPRVVPPAATSAPPAPADGRVGRGARTAGVVTAGVGAALLATGAYFALDAARAEREVSDFYARGGAWADIADADERGRRARLVARVALGVGGVAVAGGAALSWHGRRRERARPALAIVPRRAGGEVAVSWRF